MTVAEIMLEWEAKRPRQKGDYAGSLTQGDVDDLRAWMETWDDEPTAP
jgi:hypothetical protein